MKIAPTPIQREWHKITDTNGRFTSDHKIVFKDSMSLITFHNIHEQKFLQSLLLLLKIFESPSKIIKVYFFFLRSSNLLVRSSKSTSSPPALFPPGILSGKFGKSVGTAGRSGKLGPDEGRGALGAGGWWGAEKRGHVWVLNQTFRSRE